MKTTIPLFSIVLVFLSVTVEPQARAVDPARAGGYSNQDTAQGEDGLFSHTTGADNTAMGFDALDSNTTGSDNALASWIWRRTGGLHVPRFSHTATLLQNGMVLVAGGWLYFNYITRSAELGHGHR